MLHLDAFSGIAGNMLLGALLELGVPQRTLVGELAGLGLPFQLVTRRVRRGPLVARWVEVRVPGTRSAGRAARARVRNRPRDTGPAHAHPHGHDHTHAHGAAHAHAHGHDHEHGHLHETAVRRARATARGATGGRRYTEIRRLLERARLSPEVRARALAAFAALAEAEARVHGIALAQVHFHEVGAVDAIVDVTGAAVGLAWLGIERITCTPLPLGHGTVETEHGPLPLPAPATLELLRGLPVVPAHIAWETVTPTGAALVRTLVDEFRELPAMTVERIGLGAGNDRAGGLPNVLRAVLGRAAGASADRVVTLECHLDDLVPEHFDYLMERLFEAGALDVALQHLQMKKNRPGFAVRVVARPSEREALARVLFAESTTLGVRVSEADRIVLAREERRVATPFGPIRVKLVRDAAGRVTPSAEYDDCKRAARRAGVPLREVVRAAEEAARAHEAGGAASRRQR
ncbi:MAG TPA: nickel pincer cofactor biosynthesis protein LarC [Myxococcota bacterium]